MKSKILMNFQYSKVEHFLIEHPFIYPIDLMKFTGYTRRHVTRIFKEVRDRYNIKTLYIPAIIFKQYLMDID